MKKVLPGLILFFVILLQPIASKAASQDECAAWLCIVIAFSHSECSAPLDAMIDRIKDFKSPLPSLSSCSYDGPPIAGIENSGVVTNNYGKAAKMRTGGYIKDTICWPETDNNDENPRGCIDTVNFVEIFIDGVKEGNTYYF